MNLFSKLFSKRSGSSRQATGMQQGPEMRIDELSLSLADNLETLTALYENCSDVIFHRFLIYGQTDAVLIFVEGMCDTGIIDEHILAPLKQDTGQLETPFMKRIAISHAQQISTIAEINDHIVNGNPVLLVDGEKEGVSLCVAKWDKRSIDEPVAEAVVRGPRQGFIETLNVNTTLIRRIIKTPALKIKKVKIGRYTQTKTAIVYVEGLADASLIDEIEKRLRRIDIDGILDSSYIEELIEDNPRSVFPQLLSTERPDVVCANLLEGRAALLIEGSPFALVMPITFFSLMQSPEDYYERFWAGTLIRWLRYLFLAIALIIPSSYVAILTFHQEMIPTTLLLSVARSREEIPFPALVEALLMEVSFEALREAGVRLPKQVGAAVSIVGALVIGQAAIAAGLVSAPMVMVVAITGIASFTIPRYTLGISVRLLRFPLMFLAGMLGLLGLMLGVISIVVHMSALRSFGVPYLEPVAPMKWGIFKEVLSRAPLWTHNTRPHLTGSYNPVRQSSGLKPGPDQGENKHD
ncbi:hypothetical protein C8Z91_03010 [Paenibacillus elgii]|uniref:Spore germination protein n=2 Tax=Paenibacillus elgii TaxID=189691 RepID=A0A2T6G9I2_9BACL|nr:hypothetical protein C8Z91_03010 [Paenibacillus elgii]